MLLYEMISGMNPFKNKLKGSFDKIGLLKNVEIQMLPTFSDEATSLLKGLLTKKPKQRLGYKGAHEIKKHPFFSSICWEDLLERKIEAPYKPRLQSIVDL